MECREDNARAATYQDTRAALFPATSSVPDDAECDATDAPLAHVPLTALAWYSEPAFNAALAEPLGRHRRTVRTLTSSPFTI